MNTIRVSNSLDPDPFVGLDIDLNGLQSYQKEDTSRQRVKSPIKTIAEITFVLSLFNFSTNKA